MNSAEIERTNEKATAGSASEYRRMLMGAPIDVVELEVRHQTELDRYFRKPASWMQKMARAVLIERSNPADDMRAFGEHIAAQGNVIPANL